jgi:hypothetical protein
MRIHDGGSGSPPAPKRSHGDNPSHPTAHTAAPARVHPLSKVWIRIRLSVITTVTGSGSSWGPGEYGTNSAGSAVG